MVLRSFSLSVLAAVTLTAPVYCGAIALTNAGFETGTTAGWTVTNPANVTAVAGQTVQTSNGNQWTVSPSGNWMAQVIGSSTGAAALDTFFGAPAGTIESNIPYASYGDGLYQNVTGSAGDTVSFSWSLVETDYPPYDDTVFAIVSQNGNLLHYENLGCLVGAGGACDHIVGDGGTQPWTTFSYTLPTTGTYLIGIGAINTMDSSINPYLFVDDAAGAFALDVTNTPEPATVWLIVPAFAALALRRKRLGR